MNFNDFRQGAQKSASLLILLVLAACATAPQQSDIIGPRAQARWDALLSGDLAKAYTYLSPGYRSSVGSLQYQRQVLLQKVRWTGAKYIDSTCLESTCKVRISLDFALIGALPGVRRYNGHQEIEENWIKTDGQWWYVPEN